MGEVTKFHIVKAGAVASEEIVQVLEAQLADAKKGRITGIAYAYVTNDGQCTTGWQAMAGEESHMGLGVMKLFHRYCHENTEID